MQGTAPVGYTERPATAAAPLQRDVPLPQGTPQVQQIQQVNPPTVGRQSPLVQQIQSSAAGYHSSAGKASPLHVQNIDELKEVLIQHLQIEHTMLSAAVAKTLHWNERDGILYMSVHTPFEVQQLQREKNILTRKTAELYGKELKIQITLAQEETVQKVSVPARVEMVLRNIKGSIVDIQKKTVAEEPEEE